MKHAALGRRIHQKATSHGVGALGTGVNPGLVMDRLALAAAAACVRVDTVKVTRIVDAAKRRGPLRAKVGAGLSREEFAAGVASRKLGHVGLRESAAIAIGLGLPIHDHRNDRARAATADGTPGRVLAHQIALVQAGTRSRSHST